MQILAFACLWAAVLARDVPQAPLADALTIAEKRKAIDQAAARADMAAEMAMAEAKKEEAEEKGIEASVANMISDVAGDPSPYQQAFQEQFKKVNEQDDASVKAAARARLKQAMEANLEKKKEARNKAEAAKVAQMNALEHEKAMKLAVLEHEKAAVKRKLAELEKQKSEEEAQLKQALKLKKEQRQDMQVKEELKEEQQEMKVKEDPQVAALVKEELKKEKQMQVTIRGAAQERAAAEPTVATMDGFVHKAVLKKYGTRLSAKGLERAEAKMKRLVEARLKEKARRSAKIETEAPKVDLDALVKKAEETHLERTGKQFSKSAEVHLKDAFERRLHEAVAERVKEKETVAPAVSANTLAKMEARKDMETRKAQLEEASQFGQELTKTEAAEQATEVQKMDDSQSLADAQKADDSQQDTSQEDASESDSHTTDENAQDASQDSEETETDRQEEAETALRMHDSEETETDKATAEEDTAKDESDGEADSEDSTQGQESEASDNEEDDGDAEAFLQKGKALRQPVMFSTDDADLQPYLHARVVALRPTRILAARKSRRQHVLAAPAPAPAGAPGSAPAPAAAKVDPDQMCKDLCQFDTGMDGDSCVTDCRVYADSGGDLKSLKNFVTDETYNEQG